ncbi:sulfur carrier protein ThiS [Tersicoccus sp. MR15.9]|uniref:sulfur carrier protein ThiS n=1 Tax=Tersicoccus mangrovi TaxID=3121635 RepID=UPI002FE6A0E6
MSPGPTATPAVTAITVNGEPTPHRSQTCRDIVAERTGREVSASGTALDGRALGIAVAVEGAVVPRSTWATVVPAAGARVEILTAVQGG